MARMTADYSPSHSPDIFSRDRPFVLICESGKQRFRFTHLEFLKLHAEMQLALTQFKLENKRPIQGDKE